MSKKENNIFAVYSRSSNEFHTDYEVVASICILIAFFTDIFITPVFVYPDSILGGIGLFIGIMIMSAVIAYPITIVYRLIEKYAIED